MKKLFVTNTKYLTKDLGLLVARIAVAILMLLHGLPKLEMLLSDGPVQFPAVLGMSAELSLGLAVFAEVVCSVLILVGLGTRMASVPLMVTMLVAIFSFHANDVFAQKELAVLYLAAYVVLFVAGSGKYSMDQWLQPKRRVRYHSFDIQDPTLTVYQ